MNLTWKYYSAGKRDRGKKPPPNRGRLPVPNPNKATPFLGRGGAEGTDEGPFHGGGRSPPTTLPTGPRSPGKKFSTKVEKLASAIIHDYVKLKTRLSRKPLS